MTKKLRQSRRLKSWTGRADCGRGDCSRERSARGSPRPLDRGHDPADFAHRLVQRQCVDPRDHARCQQIYLPFGKACE